MKRHLFMLVLASSVGVVNAQTIDNPILKKLVEKGILTEKEAAEIDEQIAREEAEKAKYQAEIDKTATETKEKLAKLEKNWGNMPSVIGKFKKFEIGGTAYLGYTYTDNKASNDSGDFEVRRFYFDTKAFISDKDYIRFTTDVTKTSDNDYKLKIKYGYLYKDISNIIPHTGFEFGVVHTPWIDYEEHSGWWYRSIDKTFVESGNGAGLWASADLGVDFKTKTPYLSSEIGIFNGEGYDKINTSTKNSGPFHNSLEGRVTYHIFGNGDKNLDPTKDTYANVSVHLASNFGYNDLYTSHKNLNVYHIHAVYNNPMFLLAAQYVKTDFNSQDSAAGKGYSVNAEIRPITDWALFGRYDYWQAENKTLISKISDKRNVYYLGVAYTMNKYIKWIVNAIDTNYNNSKSKDNIKYMLTAELNW